MNITPFYLLFTFLYPPILDVFILNSWLVYTIDINNKLSKVIINKLNYNFFMNIVNKVKGFKDKLDYYELKSLLNKNKSLSLQQDKWFKHINEGNISIKEQLYTLLPTENKRLLIYKNNQLIDTKPFIIDNQIIIKDK